jgi:hypothetical protein
MWLADFFAWILGDTIGAAIVDRLRRKHGEERAHRLLVMFAVIVFVLIAAAIPVTVLLFR